ncbi:MerR family DNA-binding transcriptional regulator [Methylobacterium longum]|nr:MerR family DNA-binding transcriptional regulator [Methylobacterium longum]
MRLPPCEDWRRRKPCRRRDLACAQSSTCAGLAMGTGSKKIEPLTRRCGVPDHTLRYDERLGLIPYADRDVSGRRASEASILT